MCGRSNTSRVSSRGPGSVGGPTGGRLVKRRNVGIFVFDGVEVLDFAGPFEVFSRTRLSPGIEYRR